MFDSLIDRLQKLLAVKSIVTLALTIVFCVLCLNDMISSDEFMTIFTVVIAFYFGTQAERKAVQTVEIAEAIPETIETPKDDTSRGGDV